MALPGSYRVRVFYPEIQGMFIPGGDVNDEARLITIKVEVRAIEKASAFSPSDQTRRSLSSGDDTIIAGHRREVIDSGAVYRTRGYVRNDSSHAVYKHNGNGSGEIYPKRKSYLQIPPGTWGGAKGRRVSSVHTYEGDPWLRDAANEVLLRYGVQLPPD